MMKYLRRLWCRVFGHPWPPTVASYNGGNVVIFCPRCRLIFRGMPLRRSP